MSRSIKDMTKQKQSEEIANDRKRKGGKMEKNLEQKIIGLWLLLFDNDNNSLELEIAKEAVEDLKQDVHSATLVYTTIINKINEIFAEFITSKKNEKNKQD